MFITLEAAIPAYPHMNAVDVRSLQDLFSKCLGYAWAMYDMGHDIGAGSCEFAAEYCRYTVDEKLLNVGAPPISEALRSFVQNGCVTRVALIGPDDDLEIIYYW